MATASSITDDLGSSPATNSKIFENRNSATDLNDDLITRVKRDLLELSLKKSCLTSVRGGPTSPYLQTSYRNEARKQNQQYRLLREADFSSLNDTMHLPQYPNTTHQQLRRNSTNLKDKKQSHKATASISTQTIDFGTATKSKASKRNVNNTPSPTPKPRKMKMVHDSKNGDSLKVNSAFKKSVSVQTIGTEITPKLRAAKRNAEDTTTKLTGKMNPEKDSKDASSKTSLAEQSVQCSLNECMLAIAQITSPELDAQALRNNEVSGKEQKLENSREENQEEEIYRVLSVSTQSIKETMNGGKRSIEGRGKDAHKVRACRDATSFRKTNKATSLAMGITGGDQTKEEFIMQNSASAKPKESDFVRALSYDLLLKNGPVLTRVRDSINESLMQTKRRELLSTVGTKSTYYYSHEAKRSPTIEDAANNYQAPPITETEPQPPTKDDGSASDEDSDAKLDNYRHSPASTQHHLKSPHIYCYFNSSRDRNALAEGSDLDDKGHSSPVLPCLNDIIKHDSISHEEEIRDQPLKVDAENTSIVSEKSAHEQKLIDLQKELSDIRRLLEAESAKSSIAPKKESLPESIVLPVDAVAVGQFRLEDGTTISSNTSVDICQSHTTTESKEFIDLSPNVSMACDDDTLMFYDEMRQKPRRSLLYPRRFTTGR